MTKYTTNEFINKAKNVHGDRYDYSKVEYINSATKVCIICPKHGEFWQLPSTHLYGIGCKKCGTESATNKHKKTTEQFIEEARKVHGDKYDYSKVEYIDAHTKVCIICPKHGEFWQSPYNHLIGQGCKKCSFEKVSEKNRISSDEWIENARKVHKDRYDYSKTKYVGYDKKVTIICPIHGEFNQIAYDHLQGKGCPKCRRSKLEIEVEEFLSQNNIEYRSQIRPYYLSNGKSHMSLDFYLPQYNAAIECQGKQHFESGTFYDNRKETIRERDEKKYELCKNHLKLYYYSNYKFENYIDKVYNDKEELLNDIKINYEKELL